VYLKNRKETLKLIAAFAAVYIIWGSTYLAIRFAIETLPPFLMAGIRFILAGLILYAFSRKNNDEPVKPEHIKSAFITGGLLLLGGNGGVVWAEQVVPSGLTAVLIATEPLWIVLLSWFIKKGDKPDVKTVTGVLLGFAGLLYLINPFDTGNKNVNIMGALVILLASLSWASGTIYTRNAVQHSSKLTAAALQMLCGGVLLALTGLISGETADININGISLKSLLAFLYLVFVGSIIAFTSYIYLISAAGPSRASTYAYVNPVVAVFLGWLMAGEIINMRIILATSVIIISVAIINTNINFRAIAGKIFRIKKV
jgi:drug/metabolite transporter (DMT)-like permease